MESCVSPAFAVSPTTGLALISEIGTSAQGMCALSSWSLTCWLMPTCSSRNREAARARTASIEVPFFARSSIRRADDKLNSESAKMNGSRARLALTLQRDNDCGSFARPLSDLVECVDEHAGVNDDAICGPGGLGQLRARGVDDDTVRFLDFFV